MEIYQRVKYMKWISSLAGILLTIPLCAETLPDAVQHSLIIHPQVLLKSSQPLIAMNRLYSEKERAVIQFKPYVNPALVLNNTISSDDLALEVIKCYLYVLYKKELLVKAQLNLRSNRSIRALASRHFLSKKTEIQLQKDVIFAETRKFAIEKNLHQAKSAYARTVGLWPTHLESPLIPEKDQLPTSVAQAIELGLDNYLVNQSVFAQAKKISMSEMSSTIRSAWDNWTQTGLQFNQARKKLTQALNQRSRDEQRFKANKISALDFLRSQQKLWSAQQQYLYQKYKENISRFQILKDMGKLSCFLKKEAAAMPQKAPSKEFTTLLEKTGSFAYPYPNFTPSFLTENQNLPLFAREKNYYILAGEFANRANAMALLNRLKDSGFMANPWVNKEVQVLLGPYTTAMQAHQTLERLNQIMHIRGRLINNNMIIPTAT